MGIVKDLSDENDSMDYNFWKIVFYKGFLQVYKSYDSISWVNMGGTKVKNPIEIQGFELKGESQFILDDYKVYKNPYLTIYNYPRQYKVKLIDAKENIVAEGEFDNLNQCSIFLDYCFKGKIQIFNTENDLVYETEFIDIDYGDEYLLSPYDIELYYDDNKVDYHTADINYPLDKVLIKNVSDETYTNLNISISKTETNLDNIQISSDGINFAEKIIIDALESKQTKEIYIKLKSSNSQSKGYRNFNININ